MRKKQIKLCIFSIIASCILVGLIYRHYRWIITSYLRAEVVFLHKDLYLFPKIDELLHYYELKPGEVETDSSVWLGQTVTYTTNDDGLNAETSYPVQKGPHTVRIAAIGDSFTFGQYVNTPDSYPSRLEDLLARNGCKGTTYEVLNLGVSGYDIAYTIHHFMHKGRKYTPDLVIWLMNGHNFYQDNEYTLTREHDILKSTNAKKRAEFERQGNYYFAMDQAQEELMRIVGKERLLSKQQVYLEEFSRMYSGRLVLALFDSMTDPDILLLLWGYHGRRPNTWIDRDVPDLPSRGETIPGGHPNVKGYQTLANHLYQYMTKKTPYPVVSMK